jgi:hypothetical protein
MSGVPSGVSEDRSSEDMAVPRFRRVSVRGAAVYRARSLLAPSTHHQLHIPVPQLHTVDGARVIRVTHRSLRRLHVHRRADRRRGRPG